MMGIQAQPDGSTIVTETGKTPDGTPTVTETRTLPNGTVLSTETREAWICTCCGTPTENEITATECVRCGYAPPTGWNCIDCDTESSLEVNECTSCGCSRYAEPARTEVQHHNNVPPPMLNNSLTATQDTADHRVTSWTGLAIDQIASSLGKALNGWVSVSAEYTVPLVAIKGTGDNVDKREWHSILCADGWRDHDGLYDFLDLSADGFAIYFVPSEVRLASQDVEEIENMPCVAHVGSRSELPELPIKNLWSYESAPGEFVRIWAVSDLTKDDHKSLIKAMVIHYGCSPEYAGPSVLVPLPCRYNPDKGLIESLDIRQSDDYTAVTGAHMLSAFVEPHGTGCKSMPIESIGSLLSRSKKKEYLVQDYIEKGSMTMIQAQPEAGKSLLVIDMAASVATGMPWQGQEVEKKPVWYLAGERIGGLPYRFKAWSAHHSVPLENASLHITAAAPNLCSKSGADALIGTMLELIPVWGEHPGLLIIDTYTRHIGTEDENSASTVASFMDGIDALRRIYNVAVVVVHHQGHGNKSRARGSSKMRTDVDAEFGMVKSGDRITLKCLKMNDSEYPPDKTFKLQQVELPTEGDDSPDTSVVLVNATEDAPDSQPSAQLGRVQRSALHLLMDAIRAADGDRVLLADWLEDCRGDGIDRRRLSEIPAKLEARGWIKTDGKYVELDEQD